MSVYMYRRNVSTNLNVRKCAYIYIYCRVCVHMIYSYIEREIGFNCPTHYCNITIFLLTNVFETFSRRRPDGFYELSNLYLYKYT